MKTEIESNVLPAGETNLANSTALANMFPLQ